MKIKFAIKFLAMKYYPYIWYLKLKYFQPKLRQSDDIFKLNLISIFKLNFVDHSNRYNKFPKGQSKFKCM